MYVLKVVLHEYSDVTRYTQGSYDTPSYDLSRSMLPGRFESPIVNVIFCISNTCRSNHHGTHYD